MGRRKNTAPPSVPGAEKMRKGKYRSSIMPFRRGDSSRSRHGNEDPATGGKTLIPATSMERAQPAESSIRNLDANRQSPVRTHSEGQQQTPMSSAAVNGTTAIETQAEATRTNAPLNQTPAPNNVTTLPTQVSSLSFSQQLYPNIRSHLMNLASHHHLLSRTWTP